MLASDCIEVREWLFRGLKVAVYVEVENVCLKTGNGFVVIRNIL
jgi:hypothetical protein